MGMAAASPFVGKPSPARPRFRGLSIARRFYRASGISLFDGQQHAAQPLPTATMRPAQVIVVPAVVWAMSQSQALNRKRTAAILGECNTHETVQLLASSSSA